MFCFGLLGCLSKNVLLFWGFMDKAFSKTRMTTLSRQQRHIDLICRDGLSIFEYSNRDKILYYTFSTFPRHSFCVGHLFAKGEFVTKMVYNNKHLSFFTSEKRFFYLFVQVSSSLVNLQFCINELPKDTVDASLSFVSRFDQINYYNEFDLMSLESTEEHTKPTKQRVLMRGKRKCQYLVVHLELDTIFATKNTFDLFEDGLFGVEKYDTTPKLVLDLQQSG
jgi:hypothetical protein